MFTIEGSFRILGIGPKRGRRRLGLLVPCSVVCAGLSLGALYGQDWAGPETAHTVEIEVVSRGQLLDLRREKGEGIQLVNFWATWCGPCVDEFPELIDLTRKFEGDGVRLVTVSTNEASERKEVEAFLTRFQPPSRNLLLGETDRFEMLSEFDQKWKETLPYTVLVNARGEIVFRREGRIDLAKLERRILREIGKRQ